MIPRRNGKPLNAWLEALLFALAYYACASAGQLLYRQNYGQSVPFWIPLGFYVGVVLMADTRRWLGLAAAGFAADFSFGLTNGSPLGPDALFAAADSLEAILCAALMRRFVGQRPSFASLRELVGLTMCAAASCAMGAFAGSLGESWMTRGAAGGAAAFWPGWVQWWSSDFVSILLVAPVVLSSPKKRQRQRRADSTSQWGILAERTIFALALALCTWLVFFQDREGLFSSPSMLLIFILWSGLRFGVRFTALSALAVSMTAVYRGPHWITPLAAAHPDTAGAATYVVEWFLATLALAGLIPAAILTETEEGQESLRKHKQDLREAQRLTVLGSWVWDLDTGEMDWSEELCRIEGKEPKTWAAATTTAAMNDLAHYTPESRERLEEALERARQHGTSFALELEGVLPNEQRIWRAARGEAERDRDGRVVRLRGTFQDITEQRRTEQRVKHLNRVYAMLSGINEIIVRDNDPQMVLTASCRIAVEKGHFRAAWIGLTETPGLTDTPGPDWRIAAHAGATEETLGIIQKLLAAESRNESCAFTTHAQQTGQPSVCNDILSDPQAASWRAVALERGYRSMASLPLKRGDRVIGTFNLYAAEPHFFDAGELHLLDELAGDISFALEVHEREARRRQAEEALRESEERFRQLAENIHEVFWMTDAHHRILYVSPAYESIWGRTCASLYEAPVSWRDSIHPEDRAQVLRTFQGPTASGPFESFYRIQRSDGAIRWIHDRGFPVRGAAGGILRYVGTASDITEVRQAQEEQTKLAAMVAMSRDLIGIAGLDGRVMYLNPAGLSLVGIPTLEQARTMNIAEFMPDERNDVNKMLTVLETDGYWAGEGFIQNFEEGNAFDAEIQVFRIKDDRGQPLCLATVTRDIRERRKAEAERAKLEAQLDQAARMELIGRLAGGVAHDFNNMLTVILGYAAIGKNSPGLDERHRRHLIEIEKAAQRSKDITQQLLGFSRQQVIVPVPSNLNDLVADLLQSFTRLIGEDIDLRFRPAEELGTVVVDPSQVNQILLNLVANARDAMTTGGMLTIATANVTVTEEQCTTQTGATPGPHVLLSVSDTGVGMREETMAHVFEPFFTTKDRDKGTGLGLATVFGIVKQNKGFVTVHSELSRGTTFKIYLPRMADEAIAPPAAVESRATPSGAGTVLLVEDDDLVRELARFALESFGYTPLVARNADEALSLCAGAHSDIQLMLSDVVMPGMDGMALRDRVLAINPNMKVLFMSGYTSNVMVNHGVLKKSVNFIQKPFTIDSLGRRVAEVLSAEGG
jgi:PAS domain S-box-containing protein